MSLVTVGFMYVPVRVLVKTVHHHLAAAETSGSFQLMALEILHGQICVQMILCLRLPAQHRANYCAWDPPKVLNRTPVARVYFALVERMWKVIRFRCEPSDYVLQCCHEPDKPVTRLMHAVSYVLSGFAFTYLYLAYGQHLPHHSLATIFGAVLPGRR